MTEFTQQFLSYQTIFLGIVIYIATFFVRRTVQTIHPAVKEKPSTEGRGVVYSTKFAEWWNSVILYLVPVAIGSLFALTGSKMLFSDHSMVLADRALYGGMVGFFSGYIYKILRKTLKKTTNVDLPAIQGTASIPPEAESRAPDAGD